METKTTGVQFQISSSETFLNGLAELRAQKLLCDVHLVAEDETFPVHRVVLAAASAYFQAMFTGGFKEKDLSVITMEETNSKGLECVLDALYTMKLTISEDNVENILPVAHLLNVSTIVNACECFLSQNNTRDNCVDFFLLAEKFELKKAFEACHKFVLDNFESVVNSKQFNKVSKDMFSKYISDDKLRLPNGEIAVFRSVVKWLKKSDKVEDFLELVRSVRFTQISADVLIDEVLNEQVVQNNAECKEAVYEALRFHSCSFKQPLIREQVQPPRGELNLVLYPLGNRGIGYHVTETNTEIHVLQAEEGGHFSKKCIEELPFAFAYRSLSMIPVANYLFLIGVKNGMFCPLALRFDTTTKSWLSLTPPDTPVIGAACPRVQNHIYQIGGMLVTAQTTASAVRSACAKYSIESNNWVDIPALPRSRAYCAVASKRNFLYVSGGYEDGNLVRQNTLFAYDIDNSLWLRKAEMNEGRAEFSLLSVGDRLYACGGNSTGPGVEVYNVNFDQWTSLEDIELGALQVPFAIFIDNKICIGGYTGNVYKTDQFTDIYICIY